jgi:hypothetical protein
MLLIEMTVALLLAVVVINGSVGDIPPLTCRETV